MSNKQGTCYVTGRVLSYNEGMVYVTGRVLRYKQGNILATDAMTFVEQYNDRNLKTLVTAVGAKCYVPLARRCGFLLRQCRHSKGISSLTKWIRNRRQDKINLGVVDSFGIVLMQGIFASLASLQKGKPNPKLWTYVRSTHWRWDMNSGDFLAKTGITLKEM